MNLRYLNAQQRKALSILAFHMAMADGIVTDSENAMMADIKAEPRLEDFALIKQSRLSVVPVDAKQWKLICKMAGVKP